ncbi:hypothetical protein Y032_0046g1361 [Ancylostoma ceylanicum]|uniref:Reverse transcriptase domain-containing protein n=1 Tax=Ancylostoma ceylanicum TaxID=53326 RepID=A0A016UBJ3_9BILA|nr:hypothetical protein Y032_0046g1361 [Ancylostoma ceylanicum]
MGIPVTSAVPLLNEHENTSEIYYANIPLRFADDIVLISDNTPEMNQLLNELNEAGKAIGLEMNMKKTQMMANQWCDDGEVQLDGITLKKVDSYVYLGREVNMTNELKGEIGRRRKAAWAAMDTIRETASQLKDTNLRAHLFHSTADGESMV